MSHIDGKVALVTVSEYGEFYHMVECSKLLVKEFNLHPVFIFTKGYGKIEHHSSILENERWSWIELGGAIGSIFTEHDSHSSDDYIYNKVKEIYNRRIIGKVAPNIVKIYFNTTKLIDLLDVRLVFSGQDYVLSVTNIVASIASEENIKTVVVPFNMPGTYKEIIASLSKNKKHLISNTKYKTYRKFIKNSWFASYRGRVYIRLPFYKVLVSSFFKLTPKYPWVPNSGLSTLLLPSKASLEYYLNSGFSKSLLKVTGPLWSDRLISQLGTLEKRKRNLKKEFDTGPERELIIISWPPNQYPRRAEEFESYDIFCDYFIMALKNLKNRNYNILISLHPTSEKALIKKLNKAKLNITSKSLLEIIDFADIFMSVVSSTSFWSIQSNVPTINYDCYLYNYREFREAGAIDIQSISQLESAVDNISQNRLEVIKNMQKLSSGHVYKNGDALSNIIRAIKEEVKNDQ